MASQAASRPPGPPHVPCELAQQANSGGFRLAQEFDAKTNLKALSHEGTSTEQAGLLVSKQPRRPTADLRVNTVWQESWQHHNGSASPLINAAYPPGTLASDGANKDSNPVAMPGSLASSPAKAPSRSGSLSRQGSEEPPLKRQYSDDSNSNGSRGGSKSRRSSLTTSPTKERKGRDWVITTADGGRCIEPDGLHFLLKTCELLDPSMANSRTLQTVKEEARASPGNSPQRAPVRNPRQKRSSQQQQAHSPGRARVGRTAPAADGMAYFQPEGESEEDYVDGEDTEDAVIVGGAAAGSRNSEDEDYEDVPAPRRHAAGRAAAATRSSRAATRATATTKAGQCQQQDPALGPWSHPPPGAPVLAVEVVTAPAASVLASSDGQQQLEQPGPGPAANLPRAESRRGSQQLQAGMALSGAAAVTAAPLPVAGPIGRGHMVNGPCMNPDCEHPYDSPQWRKGPPSAPVLCNACGTRWLRNGTLKPLVPRRGIRYKNKPRTVSAPPAGKAGRAAAAAAAGGVQQPALQAEQQQQTVAPLAVAPDLVINELQGALSQQQQLQPANLSLLGEPFVQLGRAVAPSSSVPPSTSPALALINPALLAALLGGHGAAIAAGLGGAAGGFALPDQQSARDAVAAWLAHQQQPAVAAGMGAAGPAMLLAPEPAKTQPAGALVKKGSQVFELQAVAGPPPVMAPIFLAAPSPFFQPSQP
ncbi:hypothetical protein N2152v2_010068 [Parachlorella kessleri]